MNSNDTLTHAPIAQRPMNRNERRAFNALPASNPLKRAKTLTEAAHARVVTRMVESFDNKLSVAHNEALYRTVGLFSMMALKQKSGRNVLDMPCGAGKTQSVIAWLAAVHHLDFDIAATVAAEHVEALCKVVRELREQGVPAEKIGLLHSKDYDEARAAEFMRTGDYSVLGDKFASEPKTDTPDQRQFLLVSHQRIRGATDDAGREIIVTSYKGRARDLLIWDEVLLTTAPTVAAMNDVKSGLGALRPYVEGAKAGDTLSLALKYLESCEVLIAADWELQKAGSAASSLTLPVLGDTEVEAYKRAIRSKLGEGSLSRDALDMLLTAAGQELRLAIMGDLKSALISYRVTIPAAFRNIAILDASNAVNRLVALDPTVKRDEWFQSQADGGVHLKTYDDVVINFAEAPSGRQAMEDAFSKPVHERNSIPASVIRVIADIPADESVIVFTHKARGKKTSIPDILRRELKKAGVDPDATLNGKPRVTVLTWGRHTALNEFAHASNIVFAGIMHKPDEMLLASAVGQTGHLLTPLDGHRFDVADIKRGDIAGSLYQALSRGSCRFTTNGKARPMKVWLTHWDSLIKGELQRLMPGLTWAAWQVGAVRVPSKAAEIALRITDHLRDHQGDKVSNRAIKSALGLGDISTSTFKRAIGDVAAPGWTRLASSFAREGTAAAMGFDVGNP